MAISANGQVSVTGNPGDGVVRVLRLFPDSGWEETASLSVDQEGPLQKSAFGTSVGISSDGTTIVVGDPDDDERALHGGSAYVFTYRRGEWKLSGKFYPTDLHFAAKFGHSVSISGDGKVVAVGAYMSSNSSDYAGDVYLLRKGLFGWDELCILSPPVPRTGSFFGISVSLSFSGKELLVGADGSERAYIYGTYDFSRWILIKELVPTAKGKHNFTQFGASCAIAADGKSAVVSAHTEDIRQVIGAGAIYHYISCRDQWVQRSKISLKNGKTLDYFGYNLDLSGDGSVLVVGGYASVVDGVCDRGGYVMRLESGGWELDRKISPTDIKEDSVLSYVAAVDHSGETVALARGVSTAPLEKNDLASNLLRQQLKDKQRKA